MLNSMSQVKVRGQCVLEQIPDFSNVSKNSHHVPLTVTTGFKASTSPSENLSKAVNLQTPIGWRLPRLEPEKLGN